MQPTLGIVAMLDILGYKSFLANTQLTEASRLIESILIPLPEGVPADLHAVVRNMPVPVLDRVREHELLLSRMTRLVFADTVLIALPLTPTSDPVRFLDEMLPFFATVSLTCRRFFDAGLPLRGGVALGGFVIQGHCFAGDALLKAATVEKSLEFSGCGLEDETGRAVVGAANAIPELFQKDALPPYRRLFFSSTAPTKTGSIHMMLLRWSNPFIEWGDFPYEPTQYVESAFRAHNKTVEGSAELKMRNTIALLEQSRLISSKPN